MGKRVACIRSVLNNEEMISGGCFQQYVVADAITCLPLPDDVDIDKGSMHFVNPLTAIGLVERIQQYKGQAAVQTCAAGQLGRMIIKICEQNRIPLINIVRRDE